MLEEKRLLLRIRDDEVDATVVAAPPSTKNAAEAREPQMHQTKGKDWHFGMKAHGELTEAASCTACPRRRANPDISQLPKLLHGQEKEVFGDQAYWSEFHRQCAEASGIRYRIKRTVVVLRKFLTNYSASSTAAAPAPGHGRRCLPCR